MIFFIISILLCNFPLIFNKEGDNVSAWGIVKKKKKNANLEGEMDSFPKRGRIPK